MTQHPPAPFGPSENRRPLLFLAPIAVLFGTFTMATGEVGRGPFPVPGWPARLIGAGFAGLGVVVYLKAWKQPSQT